MRKAEKAVAGKIAVKRNRFVKLTDATKSVTEQRLWLVSGCSSAGMGIHLGGGA